MTETQGYDMILTSSLEVGRFQASTGRCWQMRSGVRRPRTHGLHSWEHTVTYGLERSSGF